MRIVVLFNLKDGADPDAYQRWARETDIPGVNALGSVDDFSVYRCTGTLGGGDAPYQYIEVIDVADMDAFGKDVSSEAIRKVAGEFRSRFADDPIFITTEKL